MALATHFWPVMRQISNTYPIKSSMNTLSSRQKSHLRSLAHHLKPVVTIGAAGLTAAVLSETEQALSHHELLKIRINSGDRALRQQITADICQHCGAHAVQSIGRIIVIYRAAKQPKLKLPENN